MRPITRHGNMPPPVAKVHKLFLSQFLTEAGDAITHGEYVQVWECDDPNDVLAVCALHPLLGGAGNPDFLLQCLLDRKTSRWYVVGLGLGQRITIGDIDLKTGEIIPGDYESAPVMYFAECTKHWARAQNRKRRVLAAQMAQHPVGRAGIELMRDALIEAVRKKQEMTAKNRIQFGSDGKEGGTRNDAS